MHELVFAGQAPVAFSLSQVEHVWRRQFPCGSVPWRKPTRPPRVEIEATPGCFSSENGGDHSKLMFRPRRDAGFASLASLASHSGLAHGNKPGAGAVGRSRDGARWLPSIRASCPLWMNNGL